MCGESAGDAGSRVDGLIAGVCVLCYLGRRVRGYNEEGKKK
jgi:hypothetical protein